MRIDLAPGLPEPRWPDGVRVRAFADADAHSVHALLEHGYRRGGGSVDDFRSWHAAMTGDREFDPEVWFLAWAGERLAGVALCWTSAFVKDLVVREEWRGRGLGEALLRHAFAVFRERGRDAVELKVHATNEPAIRLYRRTGMHAVECERLGEVHDREE